MRNEQGETKLINATQPPPQLMPSADNLEVTQIAAAQAGDLMAFNQLILRYQTLAFNIALRMIREERKADALVQESFLKAYRALATFPGGSFKCWLLHIVSNRSIDQLHNRQHFVRQWLDNRAVHKAFTHLSGHAPTAPRVRVNPMVSSALLEQAINTIPPNLRMVLLLRDIHGQSYAEVAAITGASLGTVAAQISRARAKVYAYLVAAEALQGHIDWRESPRNLKATSTKRAK